MNFITLKNNKAQEINVRFRAFRPADAEAIIACVKDEYGDKYHKKKMYDPVYITEENAKGHFFTYVAELGDGKIVGTITVNRNLPLDASVGIATGIILKKYRGYRMFFPFVKYIAGKTRKMGDVSVVFCRMVLYHDITQRLLERIGFKPCALVPGLIMGKNFRHSFGENASAKLTLGIMIRRLTKKQAGKIYLPEEHTNIARKIYDSLHVTCDFCHEKLPLIGKSEFAVTDDALQETTRVEIHALGEDLAEKIAELHEKYASPNRTFNVFMNISDTGAVTAYDILRRAGYFFTGLQPICFRHECMLLCHAGKVNIDFSDLKLIESFRQLRNYVQQCYDERDSR